VAAQLQVEAEVIIQDLAVVQYLLKTEQKVQVVVVVARALHFLLAVQAKQATEDRVLLSFVTQQPTTALILEG
jgi:hypothetical protein